MDQSETSAATQAVADEVELHRDLVPYLAESEVLGGAAVGPLIHDDCSSSRGASERRRHPCACFVEEREWVLVRLVSGLFPQTLAGDWLRVGGWSPNRVMHR
jgi:hypothetical protein